MLVTFHGYLEDFFWKLVVCLENSGDAALLEDGDVVVIVGGLLNNEFSRDLPGGQLTGHPTAQRKAYKDERK